MIAKQSREMEMSGVKRCADKRRVERRGNQRNGDDLRGEKTTTGGESEEWIE